MASENDVVQMVLGMSEKSPAELVAMLAKIQTPLTLDVLGQFDVEKHSLGWLEVLYVVGCQLGKGVNPEGFVRGCVKFFVECSADQIRLSPAKFSELVARYTEIVADVDALSAVYPLQVALTKFRRSPEHLTAVHAEFAKVAIKARCCHVLRQVLDVDIVHLGDGDSQVPVTSLLLYYYYGGLAYLALKEYSRALQFFSVVISAPAEQVSAIMVEAYKKFVLTSLLHLGKAAELPGYASFALRQIKQATPAYQELVVAHSTNDAAQFLFTVGAHHKTLSEDKNLGIAAHCHAAMTRRNIKRLTNMFITLSLDAIAKRVGLSGPQEAERELVAMIDAGEIHASINQLNGTVSFHDDEERFDSEESLARLHALVQETAALQEKITALDIELRTSPAYVKKTQMSEGAQGEGGAAGAAVDGFDAPGLMEGLGLPGMAMDMV